MCVALLPLINVVFILGCWMLGSLLWLVLTVFHSFGIVLGSLLQKTHNRYIALHFVAVDIVIAIRCQRESISLHFFYCLFQLF